MGWWNHSRLGFRGRPWSVAGLLGGLVWRSVAAVLVLYGLVQVGVRTEWFRCRVEQELSRVTGLEMRVGRIRATEALNLKIRDVISLSEDGGVELRLVRVRWRMFRPRGTPWLESIRVDGWSATFAPDAAGQLQPAILGQTVGSGLGWAGIGFSQAGSNPGAAAGPPREEEAATPTPAMAMAGLPRLEMRWGTVRIVDARGNVQAHVAGLDMLLTSMLLPGGDRVSHVDIRAEEVRVENGPRIAGLHVELVDTGTRQFLSTLDAADWGAMPRPASREAEYRELLDAMDSTPRPPLETPGEEP